jgi:release factor glutamine methyltransferase
MTIREALNQAQTKLKNTSTSPILDAEVLLCFVLKKPKEFLFINFDKNLTSTQALKYKKLITKRINGWPVAYLTNHKSFYGLDFYVDKNVLIPRPVTEELVDMVLEFNKNHPKLSVLDIGTGSGCIAVSIAKNINGRVFASDISSMAL